MPRRQIVGITGASGVIYGIRDLEIVRAAEIETYLVLCPAARVTIAQETEWKSSDVGALAAVRHDHRDVGASIASGSFTTQGMLIAPCSIKTVRGRHHFSSGARILRAAQDSGRPDQRHGWPRPGAAGH
jgi:4-hydroxy-3-polyprenylbenzoate decarboxylase